MKRVGGNALWDILGDGGSDGDGWGYGILGRGKSSCFSLENISCYLCVN